jgi:hypothetical protein
MAVQLDKQSQGKPESTCSIHSNANRVLPPDNADFQIPELTVEVPD